MRSGQTHEVGALDNLGDRAGVPRHSRLLAPFGIGSCLGSIQEWGHFTRTRGDMMAYTRGLLGGRKVAMSGMAA